MRYISFHVLATYVSSLKLFFFSLSLLLLWSFPPLLLVCSGEIVLSFLFSQFHSWRVFFVHHVWYGKGSPWISSKCARCTNWSSSQWNRWRKTNIQAKDQTSLCEMVVVTFTHFHCCIVDHRVASVSNDASKKFNAHYYSTRLLILWKKLQSLCGIS